MKRTIAWLLALCLCLTFLPALTTAAHGAVVQRSPQNLRINGALRDCDRYNIDNRNYFKLRDLAALFNGTANQFDVDYDAEAGAMVVTTGAPYLEAHRNGTELVVGPDLSATAVTSAQKLLVDGREQTGLTVWNIGNSNFFQLRELSPILGFLVDYDIPSNTAIADSTDYVPPAAPPVSCERQSVTTSEGAVDAWVLRVDTSDPRVTVRSALVDTRLGATASFEDIVAAAGEPWAVINGNFFEAYQDFKTPIGHVMTDGSFRYGHTGFTSLGIDAEGGLHMGRLSVFTRIRADGGLEWTAFEINTAAGQFEGNSVLYTPSYGPELTISLPAYVMTAENGVVTGFFRAEEGMTVPIPADGWVLYLTEIFMAQPWVIAPQKGMVVSAPEPYLIGDADDSFELDGMVSILSGSPRLVRGGAVCYDMDGGFDDPTRFGPKAAAGRTAVGIDADGRLVMVSTGAATIQQMRELMLLLGCVEAVNLDGGASRALYCDGTYNCRPGRQLTTTLQVFYTPDQG